MKSKLRLAHAFASAALTRCCLQVLLRARAIETQVGAVLVVGLVCVEEIFVDVLVV